LTPPHSAVPGTPGLRLPALGLPRPPRRRRSAPAALGALAAHAAFIAWILWPQLTFHEGTAGGPGERGGGGGDAAPRFFALAAPSSPVAVDLPVPHEQVVRLPVPVMAQPLVRIEAPRFDVNASVVLASAAIPASGSGGEGPGSGGGRGTGTGAGSGADQGPGSGGEGGYIVPPKLVGMILTPDCLRGQFAVKFWVGADGQVSRVESDPVPRDAGCRREFLARLREYRFEPAKTLDGRAIASVYPIVISR
jgi:hypothetical protein